MPGISGSLFLVEANGLKFNRY